MRNIEKDGTPDPTILIGRCTSCGESFRADIPGDRPVFAGYATGAAKAAGFSVSHDCRAGKPCRMTPTGFPECGNSWCEGHDLTEIKYRALRITYKPEAVCRPGNCWNARSATCTCSCRGKNHGQFRALTRSV